MTVTERIYDMARESRDNALKTAAAFQETNFGLIEALMKAYDANTGVTRDYGTKTAQQAREAQKLWLRWFDETANVTHETFKSTAKDFSAQLDGFGHEVRNARRKESAPAK